MRTCYRRADTLTTGLVGLAKLCMLHAAWDPTNSSHDQHSKQLPLSYICLLAPESVATWSDVKFPPQFA